MKMIIRLGAVVLGVGVLAVTQASAGDGLFGRVIRNRNAPNLVVNAKGEPVLVWRNGAKTPVQVKDGKLVTTEPKVAVKAKNGQTVEVCPNCPASK